MYGKIKFTGALVCMLILNATADHISHSSTEATMLFRYIHSFSGMVSNHGVVPISLPSPRTFTPVPFSISDHISSHLFITTHRQFGPLFKNTHIFPPDFSSIQKIQPASMSDVHGWHRVFRHVPHVVTCRPQPVPEPPLAMLLVVSLILFPLSASTRKNAHIRG